MTRRHVLTLLAASCAILVLPRGVRAHHGWSWTDEGDFQLTGLIETVRLGNPHGVLTIDAEGEVWTAEIGQPWRNAEAGLTDDMLTPGAEITLIGQRSADPSELLMKAERIRMSGTLYDLYPNRS